MRDLINTGFLYIHGRDRNFRPCVVIQPRIMAERRPKPGIENIRGSVTYMLTYVLDHMMLPGQVENWNLLVDVAKVGLTVLPIGQLKTLLQMV